MSDEWLSVEMESEDIPADKLGHLLGGMSESLKHAPDGKRYGVEITIDEL